MSDVERNKVVVREFVDAINAQDWERIDQLVTPGFVRHSDAAGEPGIRSRDDLKAFLQGELAAFPDGHEALEDLIADGDRVAARHRFTGTQRGPLGPHAPSGRRLEARYLAIYRLHNGRIEEAWAEWDNLGALAQLGHLPKGR